MRSIRQRTIVAAVAVFCVVTVGAAAGTERVYTGRVGDVFRVPATATRCTVSREAGAADLICEHTPRTRYSVVFFKDNLFVYRNGNPDSPVFSARGTGADERAAIRQAIFDDLAAHAHPRRPVITRIRVSSITLATRRYRRFARVDLDDPKKAGYAAALLGYYVASISGWKVLDLGSSQVGCTLPAQVFHGRKRAVLRDLLLDCP
jgi:hypothetical protein